MPVLPWRRSPLRILTGILLSVVFVVAVVAGAIAWYGRNTARSQSEFVAEFAVAQRATVYCGNGAGRDIWGGPGHTLAGVDPPRRLKVDDFTSELVSELRSQGFDVSTSSGDPSEYLPEAESLEVEIANLQAMGYAAERTNIRGVTWPSLRLEGRIASALTPRNNCFPEFDDVITPADPASFDVVAVLRFSDEAFGH